MLVLLLTALGQEPLHGPGEAFHDALTSAKQALYDGEHTVARVRLEALVARLDAGERPADGLGDEALVFLGDLSLLLGDKEAAREAFRRVLLADPDHVINPYDHGEDVRALFALVREEVRREIALRPPPPPPEPVEGPGRLPLAGYLPLGIPQAQQRRPGAAWAWGLAQGALAGGSVATFVFLDRANRVPEDLSVEKRGRIDRVRFGVQFPLTLGFYALWGGSVLDARRHWRREHRLGTPQVGEPVGTP